jgi:protein phosphatase slingshot
MWSAYQYLHKALENARKYNHYATVTDSTAILPANLTATTNHEWVKYYTSLISKNNKTNEVINEWYQKEERSALREDFTTPYFDCLQLCKEQEETGIKIREKLREIMSSSKDDYGSMSSVHIRQILEKELGLKLDNFKKFVDATIFQFYNQLVECATQILPNLFLGTEWNASNYDSLQTDRITHILNISSEIDNFFPDNFKYLNIRVRDVDETDLLKEFDRTNKFIQEAREQGTGCLVHCKMGVSRSASCVIAYLMKEFNWSLEQTFQFTKQKRNCINPNEGFKQQLLTYESILNAHRAKYNLFESAKSTTTDLDNQSDQSTAQLVSANLIMTTNSNTVLANQNSSSNDNFPQLQKKNPENLFLAINPPSSSSLDQEDVDDSSSSSSTTGIVVMRQKKENNLLLTSPPSSSSSSSSPNTSHQRSKSEQFFKYHTMPSNGFSSLSQSTDSNKMVNQSCKSLTLTNEESNQNAASFVLPVGTVKRQVESINFKNKSMSQFSTNELNDIFNPTETTPTPTPTPTPTVTKANSDIQTTTSPDSKRFKCELLKKAASENNANESYEFNRTKKVFEKNSDEDNAKRPPPPPQQKNNSSNPRIVSSLSFKLFSGEQQQK